MTLRTKTQILKAGLIALALWPLAHVFVVRATGMSPWRGFGWGMYTVPVLEVDVAIHPLGGTHGRTTKKGQDAVIREMTRYIKRYQALGRNARPDHVADAVFAAYPGFDLIEVGVIQNALDRKTARIVPGRHERFRYQRDAGRVENK